MPHDPPKVTLDTINTKLDGIYVMLLRIAAATNVNTTQGVRIMATMADIEAAVAAETAVEQSVITLLGQLSAELTAALAANDPAAMQHVVDELNANSAALSAAVAANPPAAPPAPEPPPAP